jgi:pimeloyl-ACP methyl ester carboxylesterase
MNVSAQTERARELVKSFYDGGARGDITSFGHSLADDFELFVPPQLPWGGTFTGAASRAPHVKALVYITAFGLDEAESLDSLSKQGPPSAGSSATAADAFGYLWINREKFYKSFAADVTADEASIMAAVQRPLSVTSFTEKEAAPAWKHIPSWYLICTNDQMIPPPAQEFMAKRMKATERSVAASHAPFMSRPQAVAEIIIEAVESAIKQGVCT